MTYLTHITLTTGSSARQYREDIDPRALADIAELLDGLLQGAPRPVPGKTGYAVVASHSGRSLIATVLAIGGDAPAPILTTGIALRSRNARRLWQELHDTTTVPVKTDRDLVPPAPFIADRLEPAAMSHLDAMLWTADWSRCLGWAWMDYAGQPSKG